MSLLEIFKTGRLRKFEGKHTLAVDLLSGKSVMVHFTYYSAEDKYDIDLVSLKDSSSDIWSSLSNADCGMVHYEINHITGKWRQSVGIFSRRG